MRPALLFYCQHSLGMGHLVRSFALAEALCEYFRVVFLNGGRLPAAITPPRRVEVVDLPPLGADARWRLVSHAPGLSVDQAMRARRERMLSLLHEAEPRALLVELFPFGRRKFAGELLPLLEAARARRAPGCVVVSSLRDLLATGRAEQQRFEAHASRTANRLLDAVLVHSEPGFARLEETFRPREPLQVPVYHTGFVAPPRERPPGPAAAPSILVSAGGGAVGGKLFRAALDAHRLAWPRTGVPMTIVAGPFLPAAEWRALVRAADGVAGLRLLRSVPDLWPLMCEATASVSQCGYNTALDILRARVPALVVPYAGAGEDEQTNRARRLASIGALRMLEPERLGAAALAAELHALPAFSPRAARFDFDGARNAARLVASLVAGDAAAGAHTRPP